MKQGHYDKMLTGFKNEILAAYLYTKCVKLEENDVSVDYKIHVDTAICSLRMHEVIEILGILLTNAYGLARVKQLLEKSGADIVVETHMKSGEIWLNFKMMIPNKMGGQINCAPQVK